MLHIAKFLICFSLFLAPSLCDSVLNKHLTEDFSQIDNYILENELNKTLQDVKAKLAELDPFHFEQFDFNFIIEESSFDGIIDCHVFNISGFDVTHIKFNALLFIIELSIKYPALKLECSYEISGNLFENVLNGKGNFVSDTTDLNLALVAHFGSNPDHSQIKELKLTFDFGNDFMTYTNELENLQDGVFDNEYLTEILYRVRDAYFPPILNTLKLVGTDLIWDTTLDELLQIIVGIINGKHFALLDTKYNKFVAEGN